MALVSDTGLSSIDGNTRNGLVSVGSLEQGASWQISFNSGIAWEPGEGDSVELNDGLYFPGDVWVKHIDVAGNVSTVVANSLIWRIFRDDFPAVATLAIRNAATGQTAALDISGLRDPDGGSVSVASVQWQFQAVGGQIWENLAGANGMQFPIDAGPTWVGRSIRAVITTTADVLGSISTLTSPSAVIELRNAPTTGAVRIQGASQSGATLSAESTLADADQPVLLITYQWQRNQGTVAQPDWVSIAGATGSTYTLGAADVGLTVRVQARYFDPYGPVLVQSAPSLTVRDMVQGFAIMGQSNGDLAAYSVSDAGDVNGDGLGDVIVGAPMRGANTGAGQAYVVFGKPGGIATYLSHVAAGTGGFIILGECANDKVGRSVSGAGDVNGDGLADLIVSAPGADAGGVDRGRAYVVFGQTGTGAVSLTRVEAGTGGFVISGECDNQQAFGSVSAAGDLNGDGLADLLLGVNTSEVAGATSAGKSYVVWGKTSTSGVALSNLNAASPSDGFAINGACGNDQSGYSVSSAGDVNGDGWLDLIIGAPYSHGSTADDQSGGRSYVVLGKSNPSPIDLSAVSAGTGGFVIKGRSAGDTTGYSVSAAGDVNGDGLADLIVGAPYATQDGGLAQSGISYVVFGKTDRAAVDLSGVLLGTGGFAIRGIGSGDTSGVSVSGAGDVNGDGLADLIIGASHFGLGTVRSYVVWGRSGTTEVNLSAVFAGTGGFVIIGNSDFSRSLPVVSAAGDVNGDGLADLILGEHVTDPASGLAYVGAGYVIFGKTNGDPVRLADLVLARGSALFRDFVGSSAGDNYPGSSANEILMGGGGNDTLSGGGGADVLSGGRGDDVIIVRAESLTDLMRGAVARGDKGHQQLARLDGGGGLDTLRLASGTARWDLSAFEQPSLAGRITSFERIDMDSDPTPNTLALGGALVQGMGGVNLFNTLTGWTNRNGSALGAQVSRQQVLITGQLGDALDVDLGLWRATSGWVVGPNGTAYKVLNHTQHPAQLLVETDVVLSRFQLNLVNDLGISASDGLSPDGTMAVRGLDRAAPWAYSSDGGSTWVNGNIPRPAVGSTEAGFMGGAYFTQMGDWRSVYRNDGLFDLYQATLPVGGGIRWSFFATWTKQFLEANGWAGNLPSPAYEEFRSSFSLAEGSYASASIQVRQTVDGVQREAINPSLITIDQTPSDPVTMSLATDSGLSASDGITRQGTVLLSGLMANANWSYTLDFGAAQPVWLAGVGSSFDLLPGLYPGNTVAVRQFDAAGNSSVQGVNVKAWRYDESEDPATATLSVQAASRPGYTVAVSVKDLVDPDGGSIVVDGYQWQYRASAGGLWTDVAGATSGSFSIPNDSVWFSRVLRVKVLASADAFGNTSSVNSEPIRMLNQAQGFVINGKSDWNERIDMVAGVGDVNGDGLADLIIGGDLTQDGFAVGRAYVVWGKASPEPIELSAVADGTGGFLLKGYTSSDFAGLAVAHAGDVNGDGLADLQVTAQGADVAPGRADAGRTYVVWGKTSGTVVQLNDLAANSAGFVINGQAAQDYSGRSVSSLGDLNGDGLADLLVGANNSDPAAGSGAGRSYVVWGKTSSSDVHLGDVAAGTGGFVINGAAVGDQSGYSVAGVGDVNGDGQNDLLIGALFGDPAGMNSAGISYVVWGKSDNAAVNLSAVAAGTGGFAINGQAGSDRSGSAVAGLGDLNGDGLADLLIGAHQHDPNGAQNAGRSYVVWGKTSTSALNLSAVAAGTGGFVINGSVAGDKSGLVLSAAGDVNGDGLPDLLVGAQDSAAGGSYGAGRAYVVWGKTSNSAVDLSAVVSGTGGFVINGHASGSQLGFSVDAAGDVNGDGLADLVVSAKFAIPAAGYENAGRSFVVFGKTDGFAVDVSQISAGSGVGVSHNLVGGSNADSYTGSTANELVLGGAGNDTLVGGGGADVLIGGAEQDLIVINASNLSFLNGAPVERGSDGNLQSARIDGGLGLDTLRLAQGAGNLDLTRMTYSAGQVLSGNRIQGIEFVDLIADTAANTLILSAQDVLMLGQRNVFNTSGAWTNTVGSALGATESRYQLAILGNAQDLVAGITATDWTQAMSGAIAANVSFGGNVFEVWNHKRLPAQVLLSPGVRLAAAPDNMAPSITGTNGVVKTLNSPVALPDLVFWNDGGLAIEVLKLSAQVSGGQLNGFVDEDPNQAGIQVSGTASALQSLFASATLTATSDNVSLGLTLSDQAGNLSSAFAFSVM